jgi:hypothetical protein
MPPAVANPPPTYTSLPDAASATTEPFTPAPSDDQLASLKALCARILISGGRKSSMPRSEPGTQREFGIPITPYVSFPIDRFGLKQKSRCGASAV